MRRFRRHLVVFLLASAFFGCSSPAEYELVSVKGVMKIDGRPAENIMLQFMPDSMLGSKGPTSLGISDADGNFVLKTSDGKDGAVKGHHVVLLSDLNVQSVPQGEESKSIGRISSKYETAKGGIKLEVKPDTPVTVEASGK